MDAWKKAFFDLVKQETMPLFDETVLAKDEDGAPLLQMVFHADDETPIALQLSYEETEKGYTQLMIYTVLAEWEPCRVHEAQGLVCRLNELLTVGCFGILYSAGQIYFRHSFPVDGERQAETVAKDLCLLLGIAFKTIGRAYGVIRGLTEGRITAEEIAESDLAIIQ